MPKFQSCRSEVNKEGRNFVRQVYDVRLGKVDQHAVLLSFPGLPSINLKDLNVAMRHG